MIQAASSNILTPLMDYLIHAMVTWIRDNGFTMGIGADLRRCRLACHSQLKPKSILRLNVDCQKINGVYWNDYNAFIGTLPDSHVTVAVPLDAVTAIYAKEVLTGMLIDRRRPTSEAASAPDEQRPEICSCRIMQRNLDWA